MTIKATRLEIMDRPLWFCMAMDTSGAYSVYKIIFCAKCYEHDLDKYLNASYRYRQIHPEMRFSVLLFDREPDETPLKEVDEGDFLL